MIPKTAFLVCLLSLNLSFISASHSHFYDSEEDEYIPIFDKKPKNSRIDSPLSISALDSGKLHELSREINKAAVNDVKPAAGQIENLVASPDKVQNEGTVITPATEQKGNLVTSSTKAEAEAKEEEPQVVVEGHSDEEVESFLRSQREDSIYNLLSKPFAADHLLPAYDAALKSDLEKLKQIVNRRISLDNFDMNTGETPLHAACRRGNEKVFLFICANIKNFAPLNRKGMTPFNLAVSLGNTDLVMMMLKKPKLFEIQKPDFEGRSPIMMAGLNGFDVIFRHLKMGGYNDYLQRDKSGRSLLSLIPPSNPVYKDFIGYLAEDIKNNRSKIIRKIARDISFIYRHEEIGGIERAREIMSTLGISEEEMILTPQPHYSNLLWSILHVKDYDLYHAIRNRKPSGFDINATDEYNRLSFFNYCLAYAPLETVAYILNHDLPVIDELSMEAIFAADRYDTLKYLLKNYSERISNVVDINVIVTAINMKAKQCLIHLLHHFWKSPELKGGRTNIVCNAAFHIFDQLEFDSVMNLLENHAKALSLCSFTELQEMYGYLFDDDDIDDEIDFRPAKIALRNIINEKKMKHLNTKA